MIGHSVIYGTKRCIVCEHVTCIPDRWLWRQWLRCARVDWRCQTVVCEHVTCVPDRWLWRQWLRRARVDWRCQTVVCEHVTCVHDWWLWRQWLRRARVDWRCQTVVCEHVTCTWQVTMTSVITTYTCWLVLSNCSVWARDVYTWQVTMTSVITTCTCWLALSNCSVWARDVYTWQVTMTSVITTCTCWLVQSNCFSASSRSLLFQSSCSTSSLLLTVRISVQPAVSPSLASLTLCTVWLKKVAPWNLLQYLHPR